MVLSIKCQNCQVEIIDILRTPQNCLYCSSDEVIITSTTEPASRISLLVTLAYEKFSKQYSCLMQMAGENGFNASEVVEKINNENIWEKVTAAENLEEFLTFIGKPSMQERLRRPEVCPQ
ncbi:hypothetical protein SS50377_25391 [Spironucleus salmonicida]|uniref:Uncharacterized protein n=1 Tax=Spironucleus salmonicida TaxID=348837 RepID=V6LJZ4_9EUKA|nr:hypothetical protein SS50377_25391 [Spironucleus salmonicida]|eukprot:EST44935.1 Hypothetical protein SS50377_14953 [Spironucleus salmonicida]